MLRSYAQEALAAAAATPSAAVAVPPGPELPLWDVEEEVVHGASRQLWLGNVHPGLPADNLQARPRGGPGAAPGWSRARGGLARAASAGLRWLRFAGGLAPYGSGAA